MISKIAFILAFAVFLLFVLIRKNWFGYTFADNWRISIFIVLLLLFLTGLFGYEKLFRQEQEHLITLNGTPFLFPKWSLTHVAYDENGPKQSIVTYGILPDFKTWTEDLGKLRASNDLNYIHIILKATGDGTRVVENIKKYILGGDNKSGYSIQLLDDLGLRKFEHPDVGKIIYFPTDNSVEEIAIECTRFNVNRPNARARCRAYFERGEYGVQFMFWPERLPDWKIVYENVDEYVETLRRRGNQAAGMSN